MSDGLFADAGLAAVDEPPRPDTASAPKQRSRRAVARERLAAAGVPVDDRTRPKGGRVRKPSNPPAKSGLRDGPNIPLRIPDHENAARLVAGGLDARTAFARSGYSITGGNRSERWLTVSRHEDFVARVDELAREYMAGLPRSALGFLQRRQLNIATADPGRFFKKDSMGRLRPKDLLEEVDADDRACIAEVAFDKSGRPVYKFHDPSKATSDLVRQLQPQRHEISGPNGGALQLEALLAPESIAKLSDDELAALKQIAAKLVAAGPVVEGEAEAVDDDVHG